MLIIGSLLLKTQKPVPVFRISSWDSKETGEGSTTHDTERSRAVKPCFVIGPEGGTGEIKGFGPRGVPLTIVPSFAGRGCHDRHSPR